MSQRQKSPEPLCTIFFFLLTSIILYSDLDECQYFDTLTGCHTEASCVNTHGSYSCVCHANYTGDGTACQRKVDCLRESLGGGGRFRTQPRIEIEFV